MSGRNTTVTLKDSSFESTYNGSTVYLLNEYGNGSNDDSAIQLSADIKIENTDFTGMKNASFQVNANQNRKVRVAFDEACILLMDITYVLHTMVMEIQLSHMEEMYTMAAIK